MLPLRSALRSAMQTVRAGTNSENCDSKSTGWTEPFRRHRSTRYRSRQPVVHHFADPDSFATFQANVKIVRPPAKHLSRPGRLAAQTQFGKCNMRFFEIREPGWFR